MKKIETNLHYLNLRKAGKSHEEALEITTPKEVKTEKQEEPKKLTTKEKKELLIKEIESLGGQVENAGASVAALKIILEDIKNSK